MPDLTDAQRTILLSAEGEWGIVQAPVEARGDVYREWLAECYRLEQAGLLRESPRYRRSFYITTKGRDALQ